MASAPVIRASCSKGFFFSSTGIVSVAISISLVFRLLPFGALAFLCDFQGLGDLFLILTAITETMRSLFDRYSFLNRGLQPLQVCVLVFFERRPLALVVVELGLIHHGDAIFDRANFLADAATAAGCEVSVVGPRDRDVERGIGTVQPAQRALGAGGKIHYRPLGARGVLFEQFVASRTETANLSSHWIGKNAALRLTLDGYTAAHVFPAGQVEFEQVFGIALSGFHFNAGKTVE